MRFIEQVRQFCAALRANDAEAAARVLNEHPEVIADVESAGRMMHYAATDGCIPIMSVLLKHGVDVNIPNDVETIDPAVWTATCAGQTDAVRWLIEHGSKINYAGGPGGAFCLPLAAAVQHGNADIVKLLVEAGAVLNVLDRNYKTPLSWAIQFGRQEIADYLRSKGALEAHQIPGYAELMESIRKPPLVEWVERRICEANPLSWIPIIPDEVPVAIYGVFDENHYCLFTHGMSERAMIVPPGEERYRYAELVLYLADWDTDVDAWQTPDRVWAINWVRRIAQMPFEKNTWLGGKWTIISNEDPPQPLSEFTDMTCWLLLAEKKPIDRAALPDGKSVVFYTLMPIHTAERDFVFKHGIVALLKKFEANDTSVHLDPARPSLV